jgi:hypothetical protein
MPAWGGGRCRTGRDVTQSDLRPREAVAIIIGATLDLAAVALLARGPGELPSRIVPAWELASAGLVLVVIGMVRGCFRITASARPKPWFFPASVVMGWILLATAEEPLAWPARYLPSDPRTEPGVVLAAVMMFGWFGAVIFVTGSVMSVAALLRRWPPVD